MVISSKFNNKYFLEMYHCGICHREITREAAIFQEGLHLGVICSVCDINNSNEDIELMSNMFLAFGGYFGMLRDPDYSIYEMLKELISKIQENK
ncbi:MAG: hypothetical protein ACFFG0_46750, partial [Candidatus Thorarchaeota archaeon]